MYETDAVVIGAGVIGLAVARALAQSCLDVIVLETEGAIGLHTSSRNSEVIHAGIYYPEVSLKAQLCVEGRHRLYEYCETRKVPFRRCGKLIVAVTIQETAELERLCEAGRCNGVDDLELLDATTNGLEPHLRCTAAILSPSTGIIDSHSYMLALLGEAEDHGTRIAFKTPFERAQYERDGFTITTGGAEPTTFKTRILVNAGGLFASQVAKRIVGLPAEHVRRTLWAKGNYFALCAPSPFRHLIYPVPVPGGLGVHLTLDFSGAARFGPDVTWVDKIDYTVDAGRREAFADVIARYWPSVKSDALQPGYAGIRPKLSGLTEPQADFALDGPEIHGVPALVNLFGIESPGLTASLAIADRVVRKIMEQSSV